MHLLRNPRRHLLGLCGDFLVVTGARDFLDDRREPMLYGVEAMRRRRRARPGRARQASATFGHELVEVGERKHSLTSREEVE